MSEQISLTDSAKYINSNVEFSSLCEHWQSETAIALDTEFSRTDTFYAKIGLLQIADDSDVYLVDPLEIDNWQAFEKLLLHSNTQIVVHSAGEDLNLLLTHIGCIPRNLFDTQIAAAFLGLGFSLSYQALVEQKMGVIVEKGETRSDWLRRPLSPKQLQYAANDVVYLLEIAGLLREMLVSHNRLHWFESECKSLLMMAEQVEDRSSWSRMYTGISNAWRLNDKELGYLRSLCIWRETESRRRNRPRNWVAKESDLQAIAVAAAKVDEPSIDALVAINLQDRKLLQRYGRTFCELLMQEKASNNSVDRSNLNYPLEASARKTLKAMQQIVEDKASEHGLAPELLGRKKQLLELMRQFKSNGKLHWNGGEDNWRQPLLEEGFTRLLQAGANNA